jgi:PBS lyase HEAT-like repeat
LRLPDDYGHPQVGEIMADNEVSITTLADALQAAVAAEDSQQTANAVKNITDGNAVQDVIAELGDRLQKEGDGEQQTVLVFALNAIDHVDSVHRLGKFMSDKRNDIGIRTTILGPLQQKFNEFPTETLTYLRQAIETAEPAFRDRVQATFEFAITEAIGQEPPAPKQILTGAGVKPSHLRARLLKKVENQDAAAIPIPSIYAKALGHIGGQDAIDLLCELLGKLQEDQLNEEEGAPVGDGRGGDVQLDKWPILERVMLEAVDALRVTESEGAINCLAETLVNNVNFKVKRQAADALGKLGSKRCIPPLLSALLVESNDNTLTEIVSDSLKGIDDWQEKGRQLVDLLKQNSFRREQINAKLVLLAIQPRKEVLATEPQIITGFLIDAARKQLNDERLLQIFAELIKVNTNNNGSVINEQLELYREKENISEEDLQALRVEIGGAETLRPILNRLEENLLEYFQKPIDRLNSDTQTIWKQTIFLANLGFIVRLSLNLAVFIIGAYFMIDSYGRIVDGSLSTERLVTLMAVFIGGGATMFTTFFTFPLKQIKQAVSDVGLANVAFISYIHRVLQISHTFSYFYLKGDVSFKEIQSAAAQIESNSHGAILTLKSAGSDGDSALYDKALLDRIQGVSGKKDEPGMPVESETAPA